MRPTRNTYFGLRHATSRANERGLIVAQPRHAIPDWGLSPAGVEECRRRFAPGALDLPDAPSRIRVVSSDFRRAAETAAMLCELRALPPYALDPGLRERDFGALELEPATRYAEVWARDSSNPDHGIAGVESTAAVAARMLGVIERLEAAWAGESVILVSHGDPLQILACVLDGQPSHHHRERPHWGNAELRRLAPHDR